MTDQRITAGANGWFPSTRHSAIAGACSEDPAERERALDILARAYWRPIYRHLRLRWGKSSDESRDLTQAFFVHLLEKSIFESYDPSRGRFRRYLRACVDKFVINANKAGRRLKRGGAALELSFDTADVERTIAEAGLVQPHEADDAFEQEWIRGLLDDAVAALKAELDTRNRRLCFEVFDRYVLVDAESPPSYAVLAKELGLSVYDVTNHLAFARRQFRRIVTDRLHRITATDEELDGEMRVVLGH